MKVLRAVGAFCYDFIIGDDWKIAAAVAVALIIGIAVVAVGHLGSPVVGPLVGLVIVIGFVLCLIIDTRHSSRD